MAPAFKSALLEAAHRACREGRLEDMREHLRAVGPDHPLCFMDHIGFEDEWTILEVAAHNGDARCVDVLVREFGLKADGDGHHGEYSPIGQAVSGGHLGVVKQLLELGAVIHTKDDLLAVACEHGHKDVLDFLLQCRQGRDLVYNHDVIRERIVPRVVRFAEEDLGDRWLAVVKCVVYLARVVDPDASDLWPVRPGRTHKPPISGHLFNGILQKVAGQQVPAVMLQETLIAYTFEQLVELHAWLHYVTFGDDAATARILREIDGTVGTRHAAFNALWRSRLNAEGPIFRTKRLNADSPIFRIMRMAFPPRRPRVCIDVNATS